MAHRQSVVVSHVFGHGFMAADLLAEEGLEDIIVWCATKTQEYILPIDDKTVKIVITHAKA